MGNDLRETYAAFPNWTQPFWTWMTGKPARNELPLFVPSGWIYLAVSLSIFVIGTAASVLSIWRGEPAPLIVLTVSIPLTVYGARLLILTISHQCAHQMFCSSKALNRIVHDALTTIVCSQDYDSYRYDHFHVHHGARTFGTFEDPVLSFLRKLGFTKGKSKAELWRRLILTCVSPRFHLQYLSKRLKYNLLGGSAYRRSFAFIWWLSIAAIVYSYPKSLLPLAVGYLVPVALLYNISALLELICEHVWMRPIGDTFGRQRITELSWGRFCGEAVPVGRGFLAWSAWVLRTVFYHLPSRLLVLTGDAPQHDYHHMAPRDRCWTISAYERRDAIDAGRMEDREVWGLITAISIVFDSISTAQSHQAETAYLSGTSRPLRRAETVALLADS